MNKLVNINIAKMPDPFAEYEDLREEEAALVPTLGVDETLRIKVLDRCGMTCSFCHNEGTPVMNPTGLQASRVSIYSESNNIPFIPADISHADEGSFRDALHALKDAGVAREVHWTGGEPTLAR